MNVPGFAVEETARADGRIRIQATAIRTFPMVAAEGLSYGEVIDGLSGWRLAAAVLHARYDAPA